MILNFKLVKIDYKYCDFLRNYDSRVMYNNGKKELRPFVGVLFKINDCEYFAPLTSPKVKHLKMKNTIDFMKICNGTLGAINFNNMIPVWKNDYKIIDINKDLSNDKKYQKLLCEQLSWLNSNNIQVRNKSYKLYNAYKNNKLSNNIKSRCCNYLILEAKGKAYNKRND